MPIDVSDETAASSEEPHERTVTEVAAFALEYLRIGSESELSVAFVDDDEMERLHLEWMGLPGSTDVLSFPMDELRAPADGEPAPVGVLGDLVLAPAFVSRQAADHGVTTDHELELLTVHGVLHLLGHDHAEPDEEREMFALQQRILDAYRAERSS
jgi:probable rRNA maturation factor